MYPEYLFNNDTQDMSRRVRELAAKDEPTLRAHCIEVSRQTDTSSLAVKEECIAKTDNAKAIFANLKRITEGLSAALASREDIFRARSGKEDFSTVCRAVTQIEAERQRLLFAVAALAQARQSIAAAVAEANRTWHLLSLAGCSVPEDVRAHYIAATEQTKAASAYLTKLDATLCEVQNFCMTFIEQHLPAFMQRLRAAADFNHGGEALEGAEIRALCHELLILTDRLPSVSF